MNSSSTCAITPHGQQAATTPNSQSIYLSFRAYTVAHDTYRPMVESLLVFFSVALQHLFVFTYLNKSSVNKIIVFYTPMTNRAGYATVM